MNTKESTNKIYVIVGYKPSDESNVPQDSIIFDFYKTKKEANRQLRILKNKYIPKFIDCSTAAWIGFRYNDVIEDYIEDNGYDEKTAKIIRKDWEKLGGRSDGLQYSSIIVKEIPELPKVLK